MGRKKDDRHAWLQSGVMVMIAAVSQLETIARNIDFASLPPDFVATLQSVGTRGSWRDLETARKALARTSAPIRTGGAEAVNRFRGGKDWSHIISRSHGGSDDAGNGLFEKANLNRSHGFENMSSWAPNKTQRASLQAGFEVSLRQIAQQTLKAGAATAVVSMAMAVLEMGLLYAQGEIDKEQFYKSAIKTVGRDVAQTVMIVCLLGSLVTVHPVSAPVLLVIAKPLAVVGLAGLTVRCGKLGFDWYVFLEKSDFLGKCNVQRLDLGSKIVIK